VDGQALTSETGSVIDRGAERADRAGPAPGGNGWLQGFERVRGGPRGSEPFDQDRTEGGPKGSEEVPRGPSRSIKIGRGKSDREE
jgi:hypothetical protein